MLCVCMHIAHIIYGMTCGLLWVSVGDGEIVLFTQITLHCRRCCTVRVKNPLTHLTLLISLAAAEVSKRVGPTHVAGTAWPRKFGKQEQEQISQYPEHTLMANMNVGFIKCWPINKVILKSQDEKGTKQGSGPTRWSEDHFCLLTNDVVV